MKRPPLFVSWTSLECDRLVEEVFLGRRQYFLIFKGRSLLGERVGSRAP